MMCFRLLWLWSKSLGLIDFCRYIILILYGILVGEVWLQTNTGNFQINENYGSQGVFVGGFLENPWDDHDTCAECAGNLRWFSPQIPGDSAHVSWKPSAPTSIGSWMLWRAACEMNIKKGAETSWVSSQDSHGKRWVHKDTLWVYIVFV